MSTVPSDVAGVDPASRGKRGRCSGHGPAAATTVATVLSLSNHNITFCNHSCRADGPGILVARPAVAGVTEAGRRPAASTVTQLTRVLLGQRP